MPLLLPEDNFDSYLTVALNDSDTTVYVNELPVKSAGVLTIYDIDGRTVKEKIYYTGTASSPNRLTSVTRGLAFTDTAGVISFAEVTANKMSHPSNVRIAMTDNVHYLARALSVLNGDEEMGGLMQLPATRNINSARDVVDKEYADTLASSSLSAFAVSADGADPTLAVNVGSGYYINGGTAALYAGATAQAVSASNTNYVQLTKAGSLVINTSGFTAGNIPLAEVVADGTTITSITDRRAWLTMALTPDQAAALAGTSGTPSASNVFVTEDDVADTSTASKIIRGNGSGKIDNSWISFDKQIFTANGTWTKPAGANFVRVVVIGAGGGGGSGERDTNTGGRGGGAGGGGGSVKEAIFSASDLASTVAITVGTGGAGGASRVSNSIGDNGSTGGQSSFGTWLIAYGGGGGRGGSVTDSGSNTALGGGGGGSGGNASASTGGVPTATTNGIGGQGATATTAAANAEWGGAAGGYASQTGSPTAGGSSIFGAPGGGAGGGAISDTLTPAATAGGTTGSYTAGGGGAAGADNTNGADGASNATLGIGYTGSGGGGGGASTSTTAAGAGGAGGAPGAGGGGGGTSRSGNSGAGGAGGRGEVRVYTW